MKHELQNVISGKGEVRHGADIQAAACYIRGSQVASTVAKDSKFYKKQETKVLKTYISLRNLRVSDIMVENYISEGAEQKVYLKTGKSVIKLNDAIFLAVGKITFIVCYYTIIFFPIQRINF